MVLTYVSINLIVTLILISCLVGIKIEKWKVYLSVILSLFLILLTARDLNTDFSAYIGFFSHLSGYKLTELYQVWNDYSFEFGFVIYSFLGNKITNSGQLFYSVTAIIVCSIYWFIFSKDEERCLQYLMVYLSTFFVLNELIQVRQGIATSLVVLACYFYARSSRNFYLFLVPSFFHSASILAILIFPLKFINRRSFYITLLLVSIIYGYSIGVDFIFNVEIVKPYIPDKLMSYYLSVYSLDMAIYSTRSLKYLIICYLVFHFWCEFQKDDFYALIAKVYVFGVSLSFALSSFYILSIRIGQLFMVFEVILIPFLISMIFSNINVRLIFTYIISVMLLFKMTISI
nr:putative O-antigen polymerase [Vibrio mimicus]